MYLFICKVIENKNVNWNNNPRGSGNACELTHRQSFKICFFEASEI